MTADNELPTPHRHTVACIIATVYLILMCGFLLHSILRLWPVPESQGASPSAFKVEHVRLLIGSVDVNNDTRLWLIVLTAGALGGVAHGLRSVYWHVGTKQFFSSWLLMYLLLPITGAVLGLGVAMLVRGGFLNPTKPAEQASTYGFTASAFLVGMFSEQAAVKLKQIAETVFAQADKA